MIHVLPHGFHRIRHYGLLASGARADNLARARELLAISKPEGQPTAAAVDHSKPKCPCCGGRMIIIEVFGRGATPQHRHQQVQQSSAGSIPHDRITILQIRSSRSLPLHQQRQSAPRYPAVAAK
jgi:hypothetical protein